MTHDRYGSDVLAGSGRTPGQPTPARSPHHRQVRTSRPCPADAPGHAHAREAYLTKLPDAEPLFGFGDFSLFVIEPESLRFVAGFGRAMAFKAERLREVLAGYSA